ncbi:MAG: FtsW/RodA/SpoVE family cell cycle protein [Faecousia sp.]
MDLTSILETINEYFQTDGAMVANVFCTVFRFVVPILAILIIWRCAKPLLRFRREPETWAWLVMPDGQQLPVTHWESIIGRSKGCDIIVNVPTVSKNHAVLTRYDDGSWSVTDIGSRGAVKVNGEAVEACAVQYGDVISLGDVEMILAPTTAEEVEEQKYFRETPSRIAIPGLTLFFLTIFQLLTAVQFCMTSDPEDMVASVTGFLVLIVIEWVLFILLKLMRRSSFEVETIAFFLSTIGIAVIASSDPSAISKQLVCIVGGILIYLTIGWSLRDLSRAKRFRYVAAVIGILLLAINLVFGREINGARNWIAIGPISFQPSELVKLCFIYVGASTMDRVVTKHNLIMFIIYSAAICGCLALMNDFGTALIFFVAFLVIAFLRSGSFATVTLACAATGFAGVIAVRFRPHILSRFASWGHAWEYAQSSGYQQTRAMMCIASGGLLGLGAGNGWLKYVAASDTDLVFAFVCEEWGVILGILAVIAMIVLGIFVVRSCIVGRSSFYTIGACAAVAIFMMQTVLNVFGTMDLLPLTGVTFPFLSNGGSSMLSAWGLLAFIKAADTRQNASFAVRTAKAEEVEPDE